MVTQLKALIVEDSKDDALLLIRELEKGGYGVQSSIVETLEDVGNALKKEKWDVLLSDYNLPSCNGLDVLKLLQKSQIDIPFILVTGSLGDEKATEIMKAGAHDYVLKHNLLRLPLIVKRELSEAESRAFNSKLVTALIEEQQKNKISQNTLSQHCSQELLSFLNRVQYAMLTIDFSNNKITHCNKGVEILFGYSSSELIGKDYLILIPEDKQKEFVEIQEVLKQGTPISTLETKRLKKDGTRIDVSISESPIQDQNGKTIKVSKIIRDTSVEKKEHLALLTMQEIVDNLKDVIYLAAPDSSKVFYINKAYEDIWGKTRESLYNNPQDWMESIHFKDRDRVSVALESCSKIKSFNEVYRIKKSDSEESLIHDRAYPVVNKDGTIDKIVGIARDITNIKDLLK